VVYDIVLDFHGGHNHDEAALGLRPYGHAALHSEHAYSPHIFAYR
jgi:hypothetical protein